jgi:hypothetical protein
MVPETIYGVTTDPSLPDSSIIIKITGIQQDEPVDALGSGNTAPDGTGVGMSTAYVRAERGGPGTGRIYFISFDAQDSLGDKCSGTVMAYVPHDQGQGFNPVDKPGRKTAGRRTSGGPRQRWWRSQLADPLSRAAR